MNETTHRLRKDEVKPFLDGFAAVVEREFESFFDPDEKGTGTFNAGFVTFFVTVDQEDFDDFLVTVKKVVN